MDSIPQPKLITQRLRLAPFELADAPDVFLYAQDPEVSKYTTWQTHQSLADAESFIRSVLARPSDEYCWALRLRDAPPTSPAIPA